MVLGRVKLERGQTESSRQFYLMPKQSGALEVLVFNFDAGILEVAVNDLTWKVQGKGRHTHKVGIAGGGGQWHTLKVKCLQGNNCHALAVVRPESLRTYDTSHWDCMRVCE